MGRTGIEGELRPRPTIDELAHGVVTSWTGEIGAIKRRLQKGTRTRVDVASFELPRIEVSLTDREKRRLDSRLALLTGKLDRPFPRPGRVARKRFLENGYFYREDMETAMERHAVPLRPGFGRAAMPLR